MTSTIADPAAADNRSEIDLRSVREFVKSDSLFVGYGLRDSLPTHIPHRLLGADGTIVLPGGPIFSDLDRLLMYQQMQRGGGVVMFDGFGQLTCLHELYRFCVATNRVDDLLIFNPSDPDNSNTYNGVVRGTPDSVAARVIALAPVPAVEDGPGADYYRQEAHHELPVVVSALQAANLAFNAVDLAILLQQPRALLDLESLLKTTQPEHPATGSLTRFLEKVQAEPFLLKRIFGGIAGRLMVFGTGKFGQVMNTYTPDIDLFKVVGSNKIVCVTGCITSKDSALRGLISLFSLDLYDAAASAHSADHAAMGYLPTLVLPGIFRELMPPLLTSYTSTASEILKQVAVPRLTLEQPFKIQPRQFVHAPVPGADLSQKLETYLRQA